MQTPFARWLDDTLKARGIKKKDLARQCGVHPSYISKVLRTEFVPPRDKAEAIGQAVGDVVQALRLAKHAVRYARETPLHLTLKPVEALLEWLSNEKLYTRKQTAFLFYAFQEIVKDYQEFDNIRAAAEQGLLDTLTNSLVPFLSGKAHPFKLDPISDEVKRFIQVKAKVGFSLQGKEHAHKEHATAAVLTGIFNVDKAGKQFELRVPISLFPVALLRPVVEPETSLLLSKDCLRSHRTLFRQLGLTKDEIHTFFKLFHERYKKLPSAERLSIWSLAKSVVNYLWEILHIKYEVLYDAMDYYDVKHVYTSDDEVTVFSRTSGLVIPEEFYGEPYQGRYSSRKAKSLKNPYRQAYFEHGLLHGCQSGCRVWYQMDFTATATELAKRRAAVGQGRKYEAKASEILSKFLQLENIEISGSTTPMSDIRRWLTLSSNRFVVISAREESTKKLIHGVILRTGFFNQMVRKAAPGTELIPGLARKLYQAKSTDGPIKKMGIGLRKSEPLRRARKIVQGLLELARS